MKRRILPSVILILLGTAVVFVARHRQSATIGRDRHGGILIGNAMAYDAMSRLVLGSLFGPIAGDVPATAPSPAPIAARWRSDASSAISAN